MIDEINKNKIKRACIQTKYLDLHVQFIFHLNIIITIILVYISLTTIFVFMNKFLD